MTYPDRETADRHTVYLWTALIVIVLTLFAAFSIEAMLTEQTCISAATVDEAGTVVSTPVVCTP